jgi:hypothetical protein
MGFVFFRGRKKSVNAWRRQWMDAWTGLGPTEQQENKRVFFKLANS